MLAVATLLLGWLTAQPAAAQQLNFQPLDRGEFTEVEQRLMVAKSLEVGADYSMRVRTQNQDDLPAAERNTEIGQDLRLRLETIFHTDVQVHLTLELVEESFTRGSTRLAPKDRRGQTNDGFPTTLNAREAYLRYRINPRSSLLLGKQEISLGDRRGKTFHALVPAITMDCKIATWCMPFGVANLGGTNDSAVTHWALQYQAWDTQEGAFRDHLEVEVFRVHYAEADVPLGRNLGPARYNPANPDSVAGAHPSQLLDPGGATPGPVYYDAKAMEYFGFRVNWEGGALFANMDVVGVKGERRYHLWNAHQTLSAAGQAENRQSVRGSTAEAELGYRWGMGRIGLRYMTATGLSNQPYSNGQNYLRSVVGYYEIVPGSYRGTRLWFNGADGSLEDGAGLGHSVNNTRLQGIFFDWADQSKARVGISTGLYDLRHNEPIPDANGVLQQKIGLEWDNTVTWYVHKALKFQAEANGILAGGAFRPDDTSVPNPIQDNFYQFVGRVVYSF